MPHPYLGYETRIYPAYRDLGADTVLTASPGGEYDIAPAGGLDLPVPPADGLWEQPEPDGGPEADPDGGQDSAPDGGESDADGGGFPPPPLMTGTSTEGEE